MVEKAYAMAPPPGGPEGSSPGAGFLGMLPPLIAMFAIFYFLLIRPQQKKQKERDSMLDSLKEGNNVLTTGGLYGKIKKIKDDVITLQIADNVRVKISKDSVTNVKDKT
jgi:preprotein translocase subunit YajC